MIITMADKTYRVEHAFSESRVLISYMGLYAFADLAGGAWELSGVPASTETEKLVLKALTDAAAGNVVTHSEPDNLPETGIVPGITEDDGT